MNNKNCIIESCTNNQIAKGYCRKHYDKYISSEKKCQIEGCEGKYHGLGYCEKHYKQLKDYGKILERTNFTSNEIIVRDDYIEIILYDKKNIEKARALADLEFYDIIKCFKWYLSNGYVLGNSVDDNGKRIKLKLHRLIMSPNENEVVDHINHDTLDNRKINLRVCEPCQNGRNKSISRNNKSGIIGVQFNKNLGKWQANIRVNGKLKHLGIFESLEEAIISRLKAEEEYFGEYAPQKNL